MKYSEIFEKFLENYSYDDLNLDKKLYTKFVSDFDYLLDEETMDKIHNEFKDTPYIPMLIGCNYFEPPNDYWGYMVICRLKSLEEGDFASAEELESKMTKMINLKSFK